MIETISYRATKQLPKQSDVKPAHQTVVGVNEVLVKLSYLPSEPLNKETMLIVELTKNEINIERVIHIILSMDSGFDENIIQHTYKILETKNIELIKEFIQQLQVNIIKLPTIWDKYNQDMLFSIKVSRYYEQLEILINARPL